MPRPGWLVNSEYGRLTVTVTNQNCFRRVFGSRDRFLLALSRNRGGVSDPCRRVVPNRLLSLVAAEDAFDNCPHVLMTVGHEDDRNAVLRRSVNHEKPLDWKAS